MGNFLSRGQISVPEPEVVPPIRIRPRRETWPADLDLTFTWTDLQKRRQSRYAEVEEMDTTNGFLFDDILLPDNVVELILSLVRPQDILNCNLVCKNWKDIIIRKSYWKLWFNREKWDWAMIPQHIKDKPSAWIVFHAQVRHHLFSKNLIRNHSGIGDRREEFQDWTIDHNGGDRWKLEQSPKGCGPLPPDPFFENSSSAWVTSFQRCSKWVSLDLWEQGLTPPVMMTCLPFSLVSSQMYTTRFDCGGIFTWTLRLLDPKSELISEHLQQYPLGPEVEWKMETHPFKFKEEHKEQIQELRSLVFVHEGKDDRFWKGHYGIKFSRSCVKIQLDAPTTTTGPKGSGSESAAAQDAENT